MSLDSIKVFALCLLSFKRPMSPSSQVGRVCMENCQQFDGFSVTYRLEVPDKNMSAEVQSCYTAISIAQAPDEMWGLLYVNDTAALRRPECQDLQYVVVALEEHTQQEASTQIYIILDSKGEGVSQGSLSSRCKGNILTPHIMSAHSMLLFRGNNLMPGQFSVDTVITLFSATVGRTNVQTAFQQLSQMSFKGLVVCVFGTVTQQT